MFIWNRFRKKAICPSMARRFHSALITIRHGAPAISVAAAMLSGCAMDYEISDFQLEGVERLSIIDAAGTELSYLRAGDPAGPRVIYVHGTPGDATNFAALLTEPIPGMDSISVDRLGFGQSGPDHAVTRFAEQAAAIAPLLVKRGRGGVRDGGRWPILVGHSLGAPIVARLAADYPDRVAGIVIVSGSLSPSLENPRWFNYLGSFPLIDIALDTSLRRSNREIMAARRETRELEPLLASVHCPIVIIHGTEDGLVPLANVQYMVEQFKGASVETVILRGEGHFIPWQREDSIRHAVEKLNKGTEY